MHIAFRAIRFFPVLVCLRTLDCRKHACARDMCAIEKKMTRVTYFLESRLRRLCSSSLFFAFGRITTLVESLAADRLSSFQLSRCAQQIRMRRSAQFPTGGH